MSEDNGSLYDQFPSHEASQSKREVNWMQNRPDNTQPYVNKEMPRHVTEAMQITHVDRSYYAFDDMLFGRNPRDGFTDTVNKSFGGKPTGDFNFKHEKQRYITHYREAMNSL